MAKLKRDVFLYMAPRGDGDDFAQCATCMMWTGTKGDQANRCHIHGPRIEITGDYTCGIYVHGKPMPGGKLMASVTPKESGLERRPVRCENCHHSRSWGGKANCGLFARLNEDLPTVFDLDTVIEPKACCNAQTPKRG